MRIVSWNMNRRGVSAAVHRAAWDYLRDELRADLALVQEAVPPSELQPQVFRSTGLPRYEWGTAVVSFRTDLVLQAVSRVPLAESIPMVVDADSLPESHAGASAVAAVLVGERHLLTAVSLYGQWEGMPGSTRYLAGPRVHRTLSDLTGIFEQQRRLPVVLAGDFNITTQGHHSSDNEAAAVFARLRAWRMADALVHTRASRPRLQGCRCADGENCAHVQTFRTGSQLDYAFISASLLTEMTAAHVVRSADASQLSDHSPVVVELDESA